MIEKDPPQLLLVDNIGFICPRRHQIITLHLINYKFIIYLSGGWGLRWLAQTRLYVSVGLGVDMQVEIGIDV